MKFIKLDEQNKVIVTRIGMEIVEGEIESELGEIGQIRQLDGTFIEDTTVIPQPNIPTNAEIAQMISDLQADLMIAGVI